MIQLNEFQLLMRCWSELGPYNVIHAMRMAGPADEQRLQHAVETAVKELELGIPTVDGNRVHFSPAREVLIEQPRSSFEDHINVEMNRIFRHNELPLRFFVIAESDDTHWFGVVADHWLGDDYSARRLMWRIFASSQFEENAGDMPALKFGDESPRNRFRAVLRALPGSIKQLAAHRSAFRVPLGDPLDFRVRTLRKSFPDGLIGKVHQLAKRHGATVHDIFLAACAQVFGEFRRTRVAGRREAVGLTTPVDLRRLKNGGAMASAIGCFLSYYTLVIARPEESATRSLIPAIASRTKRLKANMLAPLGTLTIARVWWELSRGVRARATLFQRAAPVACGLSNVNLTGSWIDGIHPQLLEYCRIGSAGPVTPITFMLTTIGSRLSLNVTYRTTAFTEHDATSLTDDFIGRLIAAEM